MCASAGEFPQGQVIPHLGFLAASSEVWSVLVVDLSSDPVQPG